MLEFHCSTLSFSGLLKDFLFLLIFYCFYYCIARFPHYQFKVKAEFNLSDFQGKKAVMRGSRGTKAQLTRKASAQDVKTQLEEMMGAAGSSRSSAKDLMNRRSDNRKGEPPCNLFSFPLTHINLMCSFKGSFNTSQYLLPVSVGNSMFYTGAITLQSQFTCSIPLHVAHKHYIHMHFNISVIIIEHLLISFDI